MKKMMIAAMVLLCGITACIEDGAPLTEETPPDAAPPTTQPDAAMPDACPCPPQHPAPTITVTASPMTITSGQSTVVSWTSTNATSCSSTGGTQSTNGSWSGLYPTSNTTYKLTCTGPGGEKSGEVTVTVNQPTLPVVRISTVIGSGMTEGQSGYFVVSRVGGDTSLALTVALTVSGTAQSGTDYQVMPTSVTLAAYVTSEFVQVATIDDQIDEVNEWAILTLTSGSSYTLGSPISETMMITDNDDPPLAPTINFSASPMTITSGQTTYLGWDTTNATTCVLSGGQFGGGVSVAINGNMTTMALTTNTNYWLDCNGPGGWDWRLVTVTVNAQQNSVCHGLYVTFTAADLPNINNCTGWPATGPGISLPVGLQVGGANGTDGVCAITCNRKVTWETMVPNTVSGIWLKNGTSDVPRWTTGGCKKLPGHPTFEAGGTWDRECDLY